MSEPVDVYADQFQVTTAMYGCTVNFMRTSPTPPAPGTAPQVERLATVRMSLEHLKVMVFILYRQMRQHEAQTGTTIPIPAQVLNGLQVGLEDWERFWRG
jgi:hypothetical protein